MPVFPKNTDQSKIQQAPKIAVITKRSRGPETPTPFSTSINIDLFADSQVIIALPRDGEHSVQKPAAHFLGVSQERSIRARLHVGPITDTPKGIPRPSTRKWILPPLRPLPVRLHLRSPVADFLRVYLQTNLVILKRLVKRISGIQLAKLVSSKEYRPAHGTAAHKIDEVATVTRTQTSKTFQLDSVYTSLS